MQSRKPTGIQSPLNLLSFDSVGRALSNNSTVLKNMYLQKDDANGLYPIIALPMPAPVLFSTSTAEGRGAIKVNDTLYVVRGNKFGSVSSNGTFTQIGTNLGTSTGRVKMINLQGGAQDEDHIDSNRQIIFFDGTTTYYYNVSENTYEFPVADEDAPTTVIDAINVQEYPLVSYENSTQIGYGEIAEGNNWEALAFFSKNSRPDNVRGVAEHMSRIFLFGTESTEIRSVGTNPLLPFDRSGDGVIPWGIASPDAKCTSGNQLYTLGVTASGERSVLEWVDGLPKSVSDPDRDSYLKTLTISDARFVSYSQGGHSFIDCVFPTDDVVMTYDVTTGVWANTVRIHKITEDNFLPIDAIGCYDKTLIIDGPTGHIYELSVAYNANNAFDMEYKVVSPPLQFANKLITVHRAIIDTDVRFSAGAELDLKMSTDGGVVFENLNTFTVPGNRITSLYEDALGQSIDFRIAVISNDPVIILGLTLYFSIEYNKS